MEVVGEPGRELDGAGEGLRNWGSEGIWAGDWLRVSRKVVDGSLRWD